MTNRICEVCEKEPSVGVACVPGIPFSAAYCNGCLQANALPWWLMVAGTARAGGLKETNDEWKKMVMDTCAHLGRPLEEFEKEVEYAPHDPDEDKGDAGPTNPKP